jgi:mono/diheme cytochrome c family protein
VADSGKVVYDTYCLACHQADGRGVPGQNPPLAKTDWVLGDKTRLIGVLLNGLNDPVEIGGETYDNPMPAHDFLTDRQIADVLTYVRSHFGNQAPAIKPEEVAAVRAKK